MQICPDFGSLSAGFREECYLGLLSLRVESGVLRYVSIVTTEMGRLHVFYLTYRFCVKATYSVI